MFLNLPKVNWEHHSLSRGACQGYWCSYAITTWTEDYFRVRGCEPTKFDGNTTPWCWEAPWAKVQIGQATFGEHDDPIHVAT